VEDKVEGSSKTLRDIDMNIYARTRVLNGYRSDAQWGQSSLRTFVSLWSCRHFTPRFLSTLSVLSPNCRRARDVVIIVPRDPFLLVQVVVLMLIAQRPTRSASVLQATSTNPSRLQLYLLYHQYQYQKREPLTTYHQPGHPSKPQKV
jgi:hypothetical protein